MSNATLFNNNNMNIKFNREDVKDIRSGYTDFLSLLNDVLFWKDTYFVGEEICINYQSANYLYNTNRDVFYILTASDIERLKEGYTVKLYAFTLEDDIKEEIDKEFFS